MTPMELLTTNEYAAKAYETDTGREVMKCRFCGHWVDKKAHVAKNGDCMLDIRCSSAGARVLIVTGEFANRVGTVKANEGNSIAVAVYGEAKIQRFRRKQLMVIELKTPVQPKKWKQMFEEEES